MSLKNTKAVCTTIKYIKRKVFKIESKKNDNLCSLIFVLKKFDFFQKLSYKKFKLKVFGYKKILSFQQNEQVFVLPHCFLQKIRFFFKTDIDEKMQNKAFFCIIPKKWPKIIFFQQSNKKFAFLIEN